MFISIVLFTLYLRPYKTSSPRIVGIIPARMSSSRFPGKPLAKINDKAMIEYIHDTCKSCKILDDVYIATCDTEIKDYMKSAKVIMTSSKHERATDRVNEAIEKLEQQKKHFDIVVMIQGDEPMITSKMIEQSVQPIVRCESVVTNLMGFIHTKKEAQNKNTIKVVTDKNNKALYFSRSVIPYDIVGQKQVCIISFTRDALKEFSMIPNCFSNISLSGPATSYK